MPVIDKQVEKVLEFKGSTTRCDIDLVCVQGFFLPFCAFHTQITTSGSLYGRMLQHDFEGYTMLPDQPGDIVESSDKMWPLMSSLSLLLY